jgi:DNA replication protein DnaC
MTSETINIATLLDLKLHGIREVLNNRLSQARSRGLGYEEFLSMLLQDEAEYRRNTRIRRLLKVAAFKQPASLEDLDFTVPRGLDKKVLRDIGGGRFILDGINIIILGPTGVGKSYLASAIGNAACRSGHTTLFFRMNALIEQMLLARAKGTS